MRRYVFSGVFRMIFWEVSVIRRTSYNQSLELFTDKKKMTLNLHLFKLLLSKLDKDYFTFETLVFHIIDKLKVITVH